MYNRILKRPMFKRGGSSFQAQGTGITSPYDTPRKNYITGGWGEWEDQTRKITKDPRGDFSYAAQGFSSLGNPYKDDGSAKTIGEMLWEGANITRESREKAKALEQKGELAILESQGGRMLAEEAHERDLAKIREKAELGVDTYKDLHPEKRYDLYLTKWKADVKQNTQGPGVYTHPGWKIVDTNVETFVEGDLIVRDAKKRGKDNRGKYVHPTFYKEDGSVDLTLLSGNVVYFDPMSSTWFTVNNPGPSATPNIVASFTDGLVDLEEFQASGAEPKLTADDLSGTDETDKKKKTTKQAKKEKIKLTITTNLKDVDINDKAVIYDEAAKIGITIKENPGGSKVWLKNLAEDEMSLPAFKQLLIEKKMSDTYAGINKKPRGQLFQDTKEIEVTEKMATGGRVGYVEGDLVEDPLEGLKLWWDQTIKDSIENNEG